jgi:hypothetical protein
MTVNLAVSCCTRGRSGSLGTTASRYLGSLILYFNRQANNISMKQTPDTFHLEYI